MAKWLQGFWKSVSNSIGHPLLWFWEQFQLIRTFPLPRAHSAVPPGAPHRNVCMVCWILFSRSSRLFLWTRYWLSSLPDQKFFKTRCRSDAPRQLRNLLLTILGYFHKAFLIRRGQWRPSVYFLFRFTVWEGFGTTLPKDPRLGDL